MANLDKILAIVTKHYQEWEENPSRMLNGYEYESTFARISGFAQEMMCRFGQSVVFEEASSLINSLTGGSFNAKQVERVCHLYGDILDQELKEAIENG